MPDYITPPRGKGRIYHFKAQIDGRQVWQSLETSDKKLAIQRARALHKELSAGRWGALMGVRQRQTVATFAALFAAYDSWAAGADISPRAVRENKSALARIVRTYHGDHFNPERDRLTLLTEAGLRTYEAEKIKEAKEKGPLAINTAHTTAHSTAQQGRSLFAVHCLRSAAYAGLELPDLSGFMGYRLKKGKVKRFAVPENELLAATVAAIADLRQDHPARWLALMLAANLGLRRKEGVAACWSWVKELQLPDGKPAYIMDVIQRENPSFDPKGSERSINIHPGVWAEMLALRVSIDTILPGTVAERKNLYTQNVAWLRGLGWKANKPTHEMRKLFGSKTATEHGLFAAQSALGHSDPRLTSQVYASNLDQAKVVRVF